MKNIKFRVWCKENEQFIQFNKMGFLEDGSLWYVQEVDENEKEIDPPYFENQNDWELMQYTGLEDKNGVQIFEGDIVKITDCKCDAGFLGVFNFQNGSYMVKSNIGNHYRHIDYDIEVIGNIYENPDLLEV